MPAGTLGAALGAMILVKSASKGTVFGLQSKVDGNIWVHDFT